MPQFKIQNSIVNILSLAGGVGGAKLAHGLQLALPPDALHSVLVNTADDFRLWGLYISPDLDTVMYTLAGLANPETGWGIAGDSWRGMEMLARYRRDPWFRLGDMDLATHILRTQMLSEGHSLTHATNDLAAALDIPTRILPMCDEPVETHVQTAEGLLPFQDYFVRRRHADSVSGFTFTGIEEARPTAPVLQAIAEADAILFCPSNPFVSIGPILAVPGMLDALRAANAPKIAVSPIVGGAALKGPAADMLRALGHDVSPYGVALLYNERYHDLLDGFIIDTEDEAYAPRIRDLGMQLLVTDTVMKSDESRAGLARQALDFSRQMAPRSQQ